MFHEQEDRFGGERAVPRDGDFHAGEEGPAVVDLDAIARRDAKVGGTRTAPGRKGAEIGDEGQPLVAQQSVICTLPVTADPEVGEIERAPAGAVGWDGDAGAAPDGPVAVGVEPELVMRTDAVHAVPVELAPGGGADVKHEELAKVPGRGQQEPRADDQVAEPVVVPVVPSLPCSIA